MAFNAGGLSTALSEVGRTGVGNYDVGNAILGHALKTNTMSVNNAKDLFNPESALAQYFTDPKYYAAQRNNQTIQNAMQESAMFMPSLKLVGEVLAIQNNSGVSIEHTTSYLKDKDGAEINLASSVGLRGFRDDHVDAYRIKKEGDSGSTFNVGFRKKSFTTERFGIFIKWSRLLAQTSPYDVIGLFKNGMKDIRTALRISIASDAIWKNASAGVEVKTDNTLKITGGTGGVPNKVPTQQELEKYFHDNFGDFKRSGQMSQYTLPTSDSVGSQSTAIRGIVYMPDDVSLSYLWTNTNGFIEYKDMVNNMNTGWIKEFNGSDNNVLGVYGKLLFVKDPSYKTVTRGGKIHYPHLITNLAQPFLAITHMSSAISKLTLSDGNGLSRYTQALRGVSASLSGGNMQTSDGRITIKDYGQGSADTHAEFAGMGNMFNDAVVESNPNNTKYLLISLGETA